MTDFFHFSSQKFWLLTGCRYKLHKICFFCTFAPIICISWSNIFEVFSACPQCRSWTRWRRNMCVQTFGCWCVNVSGAITQKRDKNPFEAFELSSFFQPWVRWSPAGFGSAHYPTRSCVCGHAIQPAVTGTRLFFFLKRLCFGNLLFFFRLCVFARFFFWEFFFVFFVLSYSWTLLARFACLLNRLETRPWHLHLASRVIW